MEDRRDKQLPITFRTEMVSPIFNCIRAGDSCSIVGIGSVGKSNFLRYLKREDVQQAHLEDIWDKYLFVYVDLNKILKLSPWGFFELILHQVMVELSRSTSDIAVLQVVDDLHQRTIAPKTKRLALRHLDRAISIVCNQLGRRLVFLIDEFDELYRTLPPRSFSALRAFRDEHKYRLTYVVATRKKLNLLREITPGIEAFEELVSMHTFWLGPYTKGDAIFMLNRLAVRHNASFEPDTFKDILLLTGGHPGLLREVYSVIGKINIGKLNAAMLVNSPHVQDECRRIWFSLSRKEQRQIVELVRGNKPDNTDQYTVSQLRQKGIIGGEWVQKDELFSPIFKSYIGQTRPNPGDEIHIDEKQAIVWINGRKIGHLTRLEYKLMVYLTDNRGEICLYDRLAQHLYPEDIDNDKGSSDNRIGTLVKRLRSKIEPDPKNPKYILTVRGRGFRLSYGDETANSLT